MVKKPDCVCGHAWIEHSDGYLDCNFILKSNANGYTQCSCEQYKRKEVRS